MFEPTVGKLSGRIWSFMDHRETRVDKCLFTEISIHELVLNTSFIFLWYVKHHSGHVKHLSWTHQTPFFGMSNIFPGHVNPFSRERQLFWYVKRSTKTRQIPELYVKHISWTRSITSFWHVKHHFYAFQTHITGHVKHMFKSYMFLALFLILSLNIGTESGCRWWRWDRRLGMGAKGVFNPCVMRVCLLPRENKRMLWLSVIYVPEHHKALPLGKNKHQRTPLYNS